MNSEKISKLIKYNGFSLMEVMIVVGLMSGIALVVMQLSQQSTKVTKTAEVRLEERQIISQLTSTLSKKENCVKTLTGKKIDDEFANGTGIINIIGTSEQSIFNIGQKYGALTIEGYKFIKENDRYFLHVNFTRKGSISGSKTGSYKILLDVALSETTGEVESCSSAKDTFLSEACISMGGELKGKCLINPEEMQMCTGNESTSNCISLSTYIANVVEVINGKYVKVQLCKDRFPTDPSVAYDETNNECIGDQSMSINTYYKGLPTTPDTTGCDSDLAYPNNYCPTRCENTKAVNQKITSGTWGVNGCSPGFSRCKCDYNQDNTNKCKISGTLETGYTCTQYYF